MLRRRYLSGVFLGLRIQYQLWAVPCTADSANLSAEPHHLVVATDLVQERHELDLLTRRAWGDAVRSHACFLPDNEIIAYGHGGHSRQHAIYLHPATSTWSDNPVSPLSAWIRPKLTLVHTRRCAPNRRWNALTFDYHMLFLRYVSPPKL